MSTLSALISNTKPVSEFAEYIQSRLRASNKSWLEIAQAFAEAREMYGSKSDRFRELSKLTRFSESKIAKLVSVIHSERLKTYAVQLSSVHSWATLYAISSLSEEQFGKLKAHYKLDDPNTKALFISETDVSRFRKSSGERSVFRNYATIQIDDEAVKGALFGGAEYEELQDLLASIEKLSAYVQVKRFDNTEKEELSRLSRVEDKVRQVARKRYLDAIENVLSSRKRTKGETYTAQCVRCFGKNRDELLNDLATNEAEAFKHLGVEYDLGKFYKEAEAQVNAAESARIDRYAKKVKARPLMVKPVETETKEPESFTPSALENRMREKFATQMKQVVFS